MDAKPRATGLDDMPLDPGSGLYRSPAQDQLEISHYYAGLSAFVRACRTPMTIAVQGDWGSGKTTALNFVSSDLSDPKKGQIEVIPFNTWKYSQFDLGDSLVFLLIHEILAPLMAVSKTKEVLSKVARIAQAVAASSARHAGALTGSSFVVDPIVTSLQEILAGRADDSLPAQLHALRTDFAAAVEEFCTVQGKERIVILIDDLDRVDPQRAVEVMEVLKVFFDSPRCVFVLAIDFEVVRLGVGAKYGREMEESKARSFFDKIIQVPFQMPVDQYRTTGLLTAALKGLGVDKPGDDYDRFVQAARLSVGNNPRSIKRLINTFELHQIILSERDLAGTAGAQSIDDLVLFTLLCAQTAYPGFHELLLRSIDDSTAMVLLLDAVAQGADELDADDANSSVQIKELWNRLLEAGDESDIADRLGLAAEDMTRFMAFIRGLRQSLSDLGDGDGVDPAVLEAHVMLSSLTGTGTQESGRTKTRPPTRTVEERDARIMEDAGATILRLVHELEQVVAEKLSGRSFSTSVGTAQLISFYSLPDATTALEQPVRTRPKFLGVSYSRKGLRLHFGRAASREAGQGRRYDERWDALAKELDARFEHSPAHGRAVEFKETDTGSPFMLGRLQSTQEIEMVAPYIARIYALANGADRDASS